nr:toll/interleukin-1 receptor domain-containing protein [Nocardia crassostreae]
MFISHSSADREWAQEIRRWLIAEGHEVFLDLHPVDGLVVGEEWEPRLHERLRWADAVVCVITPAFLQSVWCAAELSIAKERSSRLLPVRVAKGVTHPLLKAVQHADAAADAPMAREKLTLLLRTVDVGGGRGWPDDRSPYPGLLRFDTDQHRVFFGRTVEATEIAERLRQPNHRSERSILFVIGPSGYGKSSLVRAGVIPLVADDPLWLPLEPLEPGRDPVGALHRTLLATARRVGLSWQLDTLRDRLVRFGLGDVANELLLAVDPSPHRKLLLVLDQFEELLAPEAATRRADFAALLTPAIGGPVQVLATVRPEFLAQITGAPEFSDLRCHT